MTRIKTSSALYLIIIISCIIFLKPLAGTAQEINQEFAQRVEDFQNLNPQELVYIHTDREIYSPGDQISFKAYVRDLYSPGKLSQSENLHIIIIDPDGNLRQENIFKVSDNQSYGTFDLMNDLGEGEHYLISWTNVMEDGPAKNVFRKKIFIKYRLFPPVIIELSAGQTRYLPGDIAQIQVNLSSISGNPLKRKNISYIASLNGANFEAKGERTDKEGNGSFDIALPNTSEPGLVVVEVAVEHMGETSSNSIVVPTSKTPVWIDFAPEGGILLNGFESVIGFKAYDLWGKPVYVEGEVLSMNNEHVKNFKSSDMGFGSFSIMADKAKKLKIRLTKPSGIDIDFSLPIIQERGIQLALQSRNNDQLDFSVKTDIDDTTVPLHAIAEMNGILKYEKRFNLKIKSEFSIPISSINSAGELKVNILSSSGQVLAHRSVYLASQGNPTIKYNKPSNKVNDSDELVLELVNYDGDPNQISFSLSSTDQIFAPVWEPCQDIFSWFILGPEGSYGSFPQGFLVNPSMEDEEVIDHYMLFQIDNYLDWEKIKSGTSSHPDKTKTEFREELKQIYQTEDFERIIKPIKQNQFFNRYFIDLNPGFNDLIRNTQSTLEALGYFPVKLSSDEQIQQRLANGQSIMSVLMSVKPYKLMGNMIVFRGNDSFNYQGGVLIVVDGVPRGTDPGILNSISPYDVKSLKASANISDIQKYTGLNSTGVIEITTKGGQGIEDGPKEPTTMFPTLYWNPSLTSGSGSNLSVRIPKTPTSSPVKTIIQGMDSRGKLIIWTK